MPDRPQFTAAFPDDPALAELVNAFERGDYRRVRSGAAALLARPAQGGAEADAKVKAAAQELVARTEADPLAKALLLVTLLLLVFLAAWWARRPDPVPPPPKAPVEVVH
jgi:hypothetical protein